MINNREFLVGKIPEYYVYGYFDENDIPFYIGIGHDNRITNHLRESVRKSRNTLFYNKLNKMIENDTTFSYIKLKENLSLNEAKLAEEILIKLIGRRDLKEGSLCNLTNGGEGHKGYIKSEELRKRISIWTKGKTLSDEHKERLRQVNTGKKHSLETRRKLSELQKGTIKPKKQESIPNYIRAAKRKSESQEYLDKLKQEKRKRFGVKVQQLDLNNNLIRTWDNQIDAAEYIKGRSHRIIEVCKGFKEHHKKYKWRYDQ